MNVSQITHEKTPKDTKKIDQRLVSSTFRACHCTSRARLGCSGSERTVAWRQL